MKSPIQTRDAPEAIGTYSQAIKVDAGATVYLSGQMWDPLESTCRHASLSIL